MIEQGSRKPLIWTEAKRQLVPDIVVVPSGSFLMGCERGQENERPVHSVWVDRFGLARFPVTNREYARFVEESHMAPSPFISDPMFSNPQQPVVGVTWDEAVLYCDWLSKRFGRVFRLPTEAQWEKAARGGREGALYPWGDESPGEKLFLGCDPVTGGPAPVGANEPNGFGLFDMSEGVHEWCSDYYDYSYYSYSPERNPQGAASGTRRSSRGGSWRHKIKFSRCAARSSLPPSFRYADYGFRVAITLE
jgi:formylglycine-generating enzyme required for sulfatase activity